MILDSFSLYVSMLWVKCLMSNVCVVSFTLQTMPIFPYIMDSISLLSYYFGQNFVPIKDMSQMSLCMVLNMSTLILSSFILFVFYNDMLGDLKPYSIPTHAHGLTPYLTM